MLYIDDILITGPTEAEHLENLKRSFQDFKSMAFTEEATVPFPAASVQFLGQISSY